MVIHSVISICSGIGGLDIGVRLANPRARTICCVERDSYAAATLVARMEDETLDSAPIWDDLTTFDGKPWRDKVDCLIAGFPCQPWSTAGKRKGVSDDRWLWDAIWGIIRDIRPKFVFVENVTGLLYGGIEHVLGSMAKDGYDAEWGCFSAGQCGFSHKRERLFVLAKLGNTQSQYEGGGEKKIFKSRFGGASEGFSEEFPRAYFLPRYSDKKSWGGLLECEPEIEPAIYRAVDGSPCWMVEADEYREDRIRSLGNGVIPLVAAFAFTVLMNRLEKKETKK